MAAIEKQAMQAFASQQQLTGLSEASLRAVMQRRAGYSVARGRRFLAFQRRIDRELLQHRVITHNPYTAWFSQGRQSRQQLRNFIVQFSVFSNQFLLAQLHKMINADSLEGMRASKEILANEIGVVFNDPQSRAPGEGGEAEGGDPKLLATQGSIDGGRFYFRAAHFEWLMGIAGKLGLVFSELGRRRHGTSATLGYCDALIQLYGSADYATSQAASYAVENWAAAGFWDELVAGLKGYNRRTGADLPLAFFAWHGRLEAQHAQHTQEELEQLYCGMELDEGRFIRIGNRMLDGVALFWDGLNQQRLARTETGSPVALSRS